MGFQTNSIEVGEIHDFVRPESLLFISSIVQYVSSRSQVKIKGLGCLAQQTLLPRPGICRVDCLHSSNKGKQDKLLKLNGWILSYYAE